MAGRRKSEPDANLAEFGLRLRQLRVGRRLSQEELAHAAGLHRTVIGFMERGERDVGVSKLWPVAEALGVTLSELFDGLPHPR